MTRGAVWNGSNLGPLADEVMIDAGELHCLQIVAPEPLAKRLDRRSSIMLCSQKKDPTRCRRVTSATMWKAGRGGTRSPAGSLTSCEP